jgi:hypothetical protein
VTPLLRLAPVQLWHDNRETVQFVDVQSPVRIRRAGYDFVLSGRAVMNAVNDIDEGGTAHVVRRNAIRCVSAERDGSRRIYPRRRSQAVNAIFKDC